MDLPPGSHAESDGTGGFLVTGADSGVVTTIAAPWATDANGAPVPVSYTLDGDDTIVMHVDHANAAYPVVADPCFWGWKCAKRILSNGGKGAAGGALSGCVLGALPTAWGGGFGCLGGAAGGGIAGAVGGGLLGWWG